MRLATILAVILFSSSVWAVDDSSSSKQGSTSSSQQGTSGKTGSLQGRVVNQNIPEGMFTVSSAGKNVVIRATPQQIERLSPGEQITVRYKTYGNQQWMLLEGLGGAGSCQPGTGGTGQQGMGQQGMGQQGTMGQQGAGMQPQTISGTVSRLDRPQGTVVIRGQTYRAHPDLLEGLSQGELVTATVTSYGNNHWIQSIQAGSGQQGMGGTGTQEGMGGTGTAGPKQKAAKPDAGTGGSGMDNY